MAGAVLPRLLDRGESLSDRVRQPRHHVAGGVLDVAVCAGFDLGKLVHQWVECLVKRAQGLVFLGRCVGLPMGGAQPSQVGNQTA